MQHASRIFSILLGIAITFLLWPVAVPLGFGEVWWASQQAQSRPEPPRAKPEPKQPLVAPAPAPPQAEAPPSAPPKPLHAVEPAPPLPQPAQKPQDKAKPEHTAALNEKNKAGTPAQATEAKQYYRVTVRDGGTLQSSGVVVRLAGIAARDANATCKSANGKSWPCGATAKSALMRLIRARAVTCELPKQSAQKDVVARWPAPISPLGWCGKAGPSRKTLTSPRLPRRHRPPNRTSSGSGVARNEQPGGSLMRAVLVC